MHVDLPVRDLAAAIRTVKPALGKRTALPVLSYAHLAASEGSLTLTVTDLDLTIRRSIPASIRVEGEVLAGVKALANAAKGKGLIELLADGQNVRAVTDATMLVPSFSLDDYPALALGGEETARFEVDVDLLRSVLPAASKDDARPILTGVLFHQVSGESHIAATDSYRLHVVTLGAACETPGWDVLAKATEEMLIPSRLLRAVVAHVKSGPVTITRHQHGASTVVAVTAPDMTVWQTRLIEGGFPNYRQLIPSARTGGPRIVFPRPRFEEAIAAADKVRPHDATPVRIESSPSGGITVSMTNHNGGDAYSAELPGMVDGPLVRFNPKYLLDVVTGINACELEYVDALKPAVIRDTDDAGNTHTRVLMPVRCD